MELFSVEGRWWLPGKRDDDVAGKLSESENGRLTLQLQGTFTKDLNLLLNMAEQRHPVIQGVTANAKIMTLANCFSLGGHMGFPGYPRENYSVGTAYMGSLFENESDLAFDEAQLTFPHLSNWLARQVFSEEAPASFDSVSCRYLRPPDIEAKVRGGSLRICSTFSYHHDFFQELKLIYTPVIEVKAEEALPLDKWETSLIHPLRDLLTFATRHVVQLSHLEVSCKDRLNPSGRPVTLQVVVPSAWQTDGATKYLHPHEILFGAYDAGSRLSDILEQWLTKYEELRNVMMLFFAPIYNEHMYLEHQFLNLAYAAETYHRMRYPEGTWSSSDYEDIQEKAISQLQGSKRKWMKSRLRHGNEPFFKDRIYFLLNKFAEPLRLFPIDPQQFAEKVADTRNFYVHYDDSLQDKAAHGEAFFRMVQVLQSLIEVCLLSELGFDLAAIKALVERNENLKFTAKMIAKTHGLFA